MKVGIVGGRLAPRFFEAYDNEVRLLSWVLRAPVLAGNDLGLSPFRRMDNYFIANMKFFFAGTPLLSWLNGAFFYALVKLFERRFDLILVTAGLESQLLSFLKAEKCIPIVNSLYHPQYGHEEQVRIISPKLRGVIAQGEKVRSQLIAQGVSPEKIFLQYPWVDLKRFQNSALPESEEFRLLFASAPNEENPDEDNFTAKGVPLLLESFREFVNEEKKAVLYLLWRGKYNRELYVKIKELGLEGKVKVIDQVVDTVAWYAHSHITVIPFVSAWRSPEIPLSAVESLASGRPVVTTDVIELGKIVQDYHCGIGIKPQKESLSSALKEVRNNYASYQKNCRRCAEKLFRLDISWFKEMLNL